MRNQTFETCCRVFMVAGLVMSVGCSAGLEKNTDRYQAQSASSRTQQGQFTKATILKSIQDSTSLTMRKPEFAVSERPVTESAVDHNRAEKNVLQTQPSQMSQPSPLQVHLPPEHAKKSALDEKWHTKVGWSLLIDGNYSGAAAAYREAIRQNRNSAEAYLGLGSSLRMQQHIPAAIEAYQHALELQPDYTAALVHLGSIYADGESEHQDVEQARQFFSRASQQGDPFAKMALRELKARE